MSKDEKDMSILIASMKPTEGALRSPSTWKGTEEREDMIASQKHRRSDL
jgi:hypothetical protein